MMQILHLFTLLMRTTDEGLHHSQEEENFGQPPPVGTTISHVVCAGAGIEPSSCNELWRGN